MKLESKEFNNNKSIPREFTCDGSGSAPELLVSHVPAGSKTLALIADDPDAPSGIFTHWIAWNIPVSAQNIDGKNLPKEMVQGMNSSGFAGWTPPCPPSGTHHYKFTIYALDTEINIPPSADKDSLLANMQGHVIGKAMLTGLYSRQI